MLQLYSDTKDDVFPSCAGVWSCLVFFVLWEQHCYLNASNAEGMLGGFWHSVLVQGSLSAFLWLKKKNLGHEHSHLS